VRRILVVNADDFGLSAGVNRGVARAFEEGIVTSVSLMVGQPGAAAAAAYARANPELGVGLHLEPGDVASQLDRFRRLTGAAPTHLDSHHHVHLQEPMRSAALAAGRELGVPVRSLHPEIRYTEAFFGRDAIGVDALLCLLAGLPEGITELGCHPGLGRDYSSSYVEERELEAATLCDPRVRGAIERGGIELRSFRGILHP
jgi:predicted glycoside hydrolase/deacetylase ChbG (UPF0249 family)